MCKGKQKAASKVTAVLLTLMMVVVFIPTFAFATDGGESAEGITVFMTVSDQGQIAQTKDNEPMAWKEVKVTDQNNDGKYTFEEALIATHDLYYAGGADAGYDIDEGMVCMLWGEETESNLFFTNNVGLSKGVDESFVQEGDFLVASTLTDELLYMDMYSFFDKNQCAVSAGESIEFNLNGYIGMSNGTTGPLEGIKILTTDGTELGKTDANGKATLNFDKAGTYVVTAEGLIEDYYSEDNMMMDLSYGSNMFGAMNWTTYQGWFAYTEDDQGDGPYRDIKWLDTSDYTKMTDEEKAAYHILKNNKAYLDCPIIAPACIVKVYAAPEDVTLTVSNQGDLAKAKDNSAMVEKPVTVTDINKDGKLTYDEALVAAHDAYFEGGAEAGYATRPNEPPYEGAQVTKLWGVETTATMFYIGKDGISTSVDIDTVKSGDKLYASVLSDQASYSDYYTWFDKTTAEMEVSHPLKITLEGKTWGEAEPMGGITLGTWENGAFVPIEGAVTDKNGRASVTINETGTYLLTAKGEIDATDWQGNPVKCPTMAPYCIVKVTPHVHKLTAVKAKLATAKKAGNTAYWSCADCGKFFSDAKATKEIKKDSWIVKKSAMTVKAKTVKGNSKKKTIVKKSKAFTVKKAPGKVTFKKIKGNKKITVSKTGKVTVKKGLKKGSTYTVKVKVTSAKTAKYAKITKTVKLKVKITK